MPRLDLQLFKYIVWALLLIPSFMIGLVGRILSPIACIFVTRSPYYTVVKRYNKRHVMLDRYTLVRRLSWFDTFDNATDEYWWGMYPLSGLFTQAEYDKSSIIRWFMRVCWLQRNSMYGFFHSYLSIKPTSKLAWHYKGNVPIGFGLQMHLNMGWKSHEGSDVLMYAGRVLGRITKTNARL